MTRAEEDSGIVLLEPAHVDVTATGPHAFERLGGYTLLAPLCHGGMSTLHLAVAGGLGAFRKVLVLKELQRALAANDEFVEMFMAEAKLAARMNHPNIVQTLQAGQEGDRYFLTMEFLDGQPFTEVLKQADAEPAVTLNLRLQVLCDVLDGLHYAHELCDFDELPLQIVHRDVSPHNVFITYHGQVKVLDFGIAQAADIEHQTTAGVFKGKFSYAAPEQVMCQAVDRRADVFAVGVMLWECISGRRFARGTVTKKALEARLAGAEPRVARVVPTVPSELASICDRAMHVDAAQRYPSAEAFRSELLSYVLAHGELLSAARLGELIRTKFAAQRLLQHLVGLDESNGSIVRALTQPAVLALANERTPVVNLLPWVERSHVDHPSPADPTGHADRADHVDHAGNHDNDHHPAAMTRLTKTARRVRSSRAQRAFWLLMPATVALISSYFWVRAQLAEPAQPREAPLPAAAPARPPSHIDHASEIPAAPPAAAASAAQPRAPQRATPARSVRSARVRPVQRTSPPIPVSNAKPAPNPREETSPASVEHSPMVNRDAGAATLVRQENAPARAPELGDDLRTHRKPQRPRTIDVENPFQ
jgi:serine/threonine protein kinase